MVNLHPPDGPEVQAIAGGLVSAIAPPGGLTHLQALLVQAVTTSMTGFSIDLRAATAATSVQGMPERLGDAMSRGARCGPGRLLAHEDRPYETFGASVG